MVDQQPNQDMMMSKADYNAFGERQTRLVFLQMSTTRTTLWISRGTGGALPSNCLWLSFQNVLNEDQKELTILGFQGRMSVTIDDDKVHYETSEGRLV